MHCSTLLNELTVHLHITRIHAIQKQQFSLLLLFFLLWFSYLSRFLSFSLSFSKYLFFSNLNGLKRMFQWHWFDSIIIILIYHCFCFIFVGLFGSSRDILLIFYVQCIRLTINCLRFVGDPPKKHVDVIFEPILTNELHQIYQS